ncbi:MAG: rhodanese-like domain-containing protein [Streptosporangiaceae bacterium]
MVREIDVRAFAAAHRDGAYVVDVREAHEYVSGHLPGARFIPLATVHAHMADLPRNEPVYVICATGSRSLAAASWMSSAGIDAWSVAGGTLAWSQAGGPLVTRGQSTRDGEAAA